MSLPLLLILITVISTVTSSMPNFGHPRRPLKSKPFPFVHSTPKTNLKRKLATDAYTPSQNSACSYFTVQPVPTTPVSNFQYNYLNLDTSFYKNIVNGLVPVAGSNLVSEEALLAAARITSYMLAGRPDIVQTLADNKVFITIMAMTEVTTDVPIHSTLPGLWPSSPWDSYRGIGATAYMPTTSAGEENVLCKPTCYTGMNAANDQCDIYHGENILVHEFGHSMTSNSGDSWSPPIYARKDGTGGNLVDLLSASYVAATSQNKWENTYADDNAIEYAAEGIQSFLNVNAQSTPSDGIHNNIDTRSELKNYDETLYDILSELFPTTSSQSDSTGTPMDWRPPRIEKCGCSDTDRIDFPINQFEVLSPSEPPCLKVDNQCVTTCPETYYPYFPSSGSDGICKACLTRLGCGNCISSQVCTSCTNPNKVLHQGTCRSNCPNGLVPAGTNNECIEGCDITTTLSDITAIGGTVGTCVAPTARFISGTSTGTTVLSHDSSCEPTCPTGHTISGNTICSKATEQTDGCTNDHEDCDYWASSGECDNNPGYMEVSCKKACNICSTSLVGGGTLTPSQCSADPCDLGSNAIPTNGKIGTCSTANWVNGLLPSGSECQPECNPGFVPSGTTKCFKGSLTATICSSTPPSPCNDARNNVPYGTYGNCPASLNSGATCRPQCNQGFSLAASITGSSSSPRLDHSCDNGILTRATCDACTSICSTGTYADIMCTTLTDRHCSTCDTSRCADLEPPLFLQGCGGNNPGICQECATGKMFQSSDHTCVSASCTLPASFEGHYRVETSTSTDSCIYSNILEDNQSCNVICKNGFEPESSITSTGLSFGCTGGVLISPTIECVPKNCYLPSSFNENVIGDTCGSSGSQLLDGISCKVKCNSEYIVNSGTLTFSCSAGALISTPTLTCDPKPCTSAANGQNCRNGGTVTGSIPTGNCGCSCATEYSGNNCETEVPCATGANGAACENGQPMGTLAANDCSCNCNNGFEGDTCSTAILCTVGTNGQVCQHNGTPSGTQVQNNCGCTCVSGYQGDHCEILTPCTIGANNEGCDNGGTPKGVTGQCSCQCPLGYSGSNCKTVDECTTAANGQGCVNGGSAVGKIADGNCACQCLTLGFEGINCEIATLCTGGTRGGTPCQNGGTARGTTAANDCGCDCLLGWTGAFCQTELQCTVGENGNACEHGSSVGNIHIQTCKCQCETNYEGANCKTLITNVPSPSVYTPNESPSPANQPPPQPPNESPSPADQPPPQPPNESPSPASQPPPQPPNESPSPANQPPPQPPNESPGPARSQSPSPVNELSPSSSTDTPTNGGTTGSASTTGTTGSAGTSTSSAGTGATTTGTTSGSTDGGSGSSPDSGSTSSDGGYGSGKGGTTSGDSDGDGGYGSGGGGGGGGIVTPASCSTGKVNAAGDGCAPTCSTGEVNAAGDACAPSCTTGAVNAAGDGCAPSCTTGAVNAAANGCTDPDATFDKPGTFETPGQYTPPGEFTPAEDSAGNDVSNNGGNDGDDSIDSTTNYFIYGGIIIFVLLIVIVVLVVNRRRKRSSSSSQRYNAKNNLDPLELEIGTINTSNPAAVAIELQTPVADDSEVWVDHFDPATKRTFYFNRLTGETTWEKKTKTHARAKSSLMPEGWEKHVTDGNIYYANRKTGMSTWEKPKL